MNLGDHIRTAALTPPAGVFPCAVFAADWVVARGYPDPFDFLRDASPAAAMRRYVAAGGVEGLAREGMARAGLSPALVCGFGDVGVIERATLDGENRACAIYADGRWVTLGARGIESGPATALAIWRL